MDFKGNRETFCYSKYLLCLNKGIYLRLLRRTKKGQNTTILRVDKGKQKHDFLV